MKRRDLIKVGVLGAGYAKFDLFQNIVNAIGSQLVGSSTAQASTGSSANYLLFLHPGAPPRWCSDSFLSPNFRIENGVANDEYIPHPVVRNVAKDGEGIYLTSYTNTNSLTTYETTVASYSYRDRDNNIGQIYLPKLWEISLPEWDGSDASINDVSPFRMSEMLNQTMIIRGYQLLADFGHVKGPALQAQPVASEPSISGLVSDSAASASKLVPAIALTDSPSRPLGFRAESTSVTLGNADGSSNRATDLLQSFLRAGLGTGHASNRQLIQTAVDTALSIYKADAIAQNPKAEALFDNMQAVNQLVEKLSSIDIGAEYTALKNKYAALVRYCCLPSPGLIGELKLTTNGSGKITGVPYMSDHYSDKFAIGELFITHGLTGSFTFICGGQAVPGSYVGYSNNPQGVQNDEHAVTDRMLSAFAHNWKYRAWMACVREFSKSIGPAEWAKTVVQYGAEYNRSPNKSSGGSDHAINACVTSLLSGALTSFIPIGNVYRSAITNSDHSNYGTYGVGAPTDIEGKGTIKITNEYVANTVMNLMGIESPFRDKTSLIKKANGQWLPKTERPRNV